MAGTYLPGEAFLSLSQALMWKEGGKVAEGPGGGSGATAGSQSQVGLGCWLRE